MAIVEGEELKQYQININGHAFSVSSPYGEEHIREVEKFLNSRIAEASASSGSYGPVSLAILVALNLADELLTLKNQQSAFDGDWKETVLAMCNQLDKVTAQSS